MKKLLFYVFLYTVFFSGLYGGSFSQELPLTGFVFDQTKTKLGRDFFEAFSMLWEPPPGLEKVDIYITEFTDPRWGTQIYVYVEDVLVFVDMLKPQAEDIQEKADQAIDSVLRYFLWKAEQEKALKDEAQFF